MTTFMAVIFLWQFPPLNFAIFSGNSNPGPLFLLFGFPESLNGNSHPYFLPFPPKIAILAPYFCYFARRDSPTTARPQQKPCRSSPARARGKAKAHAEAPAEAPTAPTATGGHKKKRQPFRLSSFWSGKRGSDPRPQPWQGCALPTELFPHSLSRLGLQIYNDILNPQKNLQFFREIYTSIEVLNSRRNRRSFSK